MIDLDAIRASRAACADIPWSCPCVSGEQLDALIDELERMRGERAAVVAYLRTRGGIAADLADDIERGDHRREHVASDEDDDDEDPSSSWRFCEGCGCRKETARYRSWSDHAWCSDCTSRE